MSEAPAYFSRILTAVEWSIRQLAKPRKKRVEAIQQYVGAHYGDGGSDLRVPTNFLELAVTIYMRQLAAHAPQVLVTARNHDLQPQAKSMEIAINQIPEEIGLASTLRRAVVEAIFCFAVVKVGITPSGKQIQGQPYGKPFVDLVSVDDYFCDMSAKTRDSIQFEGNDYWPTIEQARAMFPDVDGLQADPHTVTGDQGEKRAESVTTGEGAEVFKDRVWLRDVWIAAENKLITYSVKSGKVLNVVDWDGPEGGPYRMLGFSDVPGNLLPLPPVALWRDLHELGNSLFRKLSRQADSKKTVAAFQGGNDDDVESLRRASDGEGIRYSGQKPEPITVGGIDAPALAFYLQVRDLYSYFCGNLDSLGGLAPSTETVGQDKLLTEAANSRLAAMGERTTEFVRDIFKSLAWFEWTDPIRERVIEKPVKGTSISVRRIWSEKTRVGDFMDYNFDVDVYSMKDESPTTRVQKLGMVLERFIYPVLPSLEAQGGRLDFEALTDVLGRLSNTPELSEIVKFQDAQPQPDPMQEADPAAPSKPANTTRTYERVNRPGGTRQGNDHTMMQLLMGGKVQAASGAAIGKPVS